MNHQRNYFILTILFLAMICFIVLGLLDEKRRIMNNAVTFAEFGYGQAKIGATREQMTNQLSTLFQKHK